MKQVKVAPGYAAVPLNGQLWNQGQTITLTDNQYAGLPSIILQQLELIGDFPDQGPNSNWPSPSPISYTDQLIDNELIRQGVPIFLIWDGSDYQPQTLKAATSRPKTFIGPTDPHGMANVVLATRDQWIRN